MPRPGPIETQLLALPQADRAAWKATQLASAYALLPIGQRTFTLSGITLTVSTCRASGNSLECTIIANRSGVPIPISNPVSFVNPPIIVNGGEVLLNVLQRIIADVALTAEARSA